MRARSLFDLISGPILISRGIDHVTFVGRQCYATPRFCFSQPWLRASTSQLVTSDGSFASWAWTFIRLSESLYTGCWETCFPCQESGAHGLPVALESSRHLIARYDISSLKLAEAIGTTSLHIIFRLFTSRTRSLHSGGRLRSSPFTRTRPEGIPLRRARNKLNGPRRSRTSRPDGMRTCI